MQQQQLMQQQQQQQANSYMLAPQPQQRYPSANAAQSPPAQQQQRQLPPQKGEPGYLEQLWQRRRDVAKLCILSLVVLLAISAHSAAWHYLREFIETTPKLTFWQEVALRTAYPAFVLIVLWHFKSFLTKQ